MHSTTQSKAPSGSRSWLQRVVLLHIVVIILEMSMVQKCCAVIISKSYQRGFSGSDVTYSGGINASATVASRTTCIHLAIRLQKNIFRLTDNTGTASSNRSSMLCEIFADEAISSSKLTYATSSLPDGAPIVFSALDTKIQTPSSYRTVVVSMLTKYTCDATRPDAPSPFASVVVGFRMNAVGRPRFFYEFKCKDLYDYSFQINKTTIFQYHTEYADGGCPANYVMTGVEDFNTLGVQHMITCQPLLAPATVNAMDCYNIDLMNTTALEDPNLKMRIDAQWPAECGPGYVITAMRMISTGTYGKPWETDRMTCCRLVLS